MSTGPYDKVVPAWDAKVAFTTIINNTSTTTTNTTVINTRTSSTSSTTNDTGTIVGSVIGVLVIILIIVLVVLCCRRCRRKRAARRQRQRQQQEDELKEQRRLQRRSTDFTSDDVPASGETGGCNDGARAAKVPAIVLSNEPAEGEPQADRGRWNGAGAPYQHPQPYAVGANYTEAQPPSVQPLPPALYASPDAQPLQQHNGPHYHHEQQPPRMEAYQEHYQYDHQYDDGANHHHQPYQYENGAHNNHHPYDYHDNRPYQQHYQ